MAVVGEKPTVIDSRRPLQMRPIQLVDRDDPAVVKLPELAPQPSEQTIGCLRGARRVDQDQRRIRAFLSVMEPAGIEPATSCLQ
jgi:hypothetical protein